MQTLQQMAGTYYFRSPYHKNRKKLPFNIESDGYVSTVEYKGWKAYLVQSTYTVEVLNEMINKGIIKEGNVDFPKLSKPE